MKKLSFFLLTTFLLLHGLVAQNSADSSCSSWDQWLRSWEQDAYSIGSEATPVTAVEYHYFLNEKAVLKSSWSVLNGRYFYDSSFMTDAEETEPSDSHVCIVRTFLPKTNRYQYTVVPGREEVVIAAVYEQKIQQAFIAWRITSPYSALNNPTSAELRDYINIKIKEAYEIFMIQDVKYLQLAYPLVSAASGMPFEEDTANPPGTLWQQIDTFVNYLKGCDLSNTSSSSDENPQSASLITHYSSSTTSCDQFIQRWNLKIIEADEKNSTLFPGMTRQVELLDATHATMRAPWVYGADLSVLEDTPETTKKISNT